MAVRPFGIIALKTLKLFGWRLWYRVCSISIKYWPPSTSCRLWWSLLYFYQILTTFNKLTIVVEFVLFLSNTDHLQQVDDCGRVCSISIEYWPPSTSWRLWQSVLYFYRILTTFNKLSIVVEFVLLVSNTDHLQQVDDCGRVCSISIEYWPPSTIWRLWYRVCSISIKYWPPSTSCRLW
jgi:VanZ family protein